MSVSTNKDFLQNTDLTEKENEILAEIQIKIGFVPHKCIWRSSYYNTQNIGAIHYSGVFEKKEVILKIQGAKPNISEAYVIDQFQRQNKSKIIRPPKVLFYEGWSDKLGCEILILEKIDGPQILESKKIQAEDKITEFLDAVSEIRKNSLPQDPWVAKPERNTFFSPDKLLEASIKAYPDHKLRKTSDSLLIKRGFEALEKMYSEIEPEFLHGHLSVYDLKKTSDGSIVVFSNLFWKWKFPLQDLVFGYHWFMLEMEHIPEITNRDIQNQKNVWIGCMKKSQAFLNHPNANTLLDAALFERSLATLAMDGLMLSTNSEVANFFIETARQEIGSQIAV